MKTVLTQNRWVSQGKQGAWVLCAVLVIAVLGVFSYQSSRPIFEAYYQNSSDQPILQRLPDGTELQLAPNSAVHLRFYERVRRAAVQQGEVVFVMDAQPVPLRVEAGKVQVTATEGALKLNQGTEATEVQVVEGTVQTQKGWWWPDRQELQAGQHVRWFD